MSIRYQRLDAATMPTFAPLMYERFRPYFTGQKSSEKLIAFGAYQLWQAVGVILGVQDGEKANLLAVVVRPEYQNTGIATELVRLLEDAVRQQGGVHLEAFYHENPPLERVFAKRGWDAPHVFMMTVECQFEPFRASPIYQNLPALPDGYALFLWGALTAEDRSTIVDREAQPGGWFSASLTSEYSVSPFINEALLEPNCSVGLRYHGEVIGWMIVHRLNQDTMNFISLFLDPEHRRTSLGIALVVEAVRRCYEIYSKTHPNMRTFWQYSPSNDVMRRMGEQYLVPYAVSHQRELKSKVMVSNT